MFCWVVLFYIEAYFSIPPFICIMKYISYIDNKTKRYNTLLIQFKVEFKNSFWRTDVCFGGNALSFNPFFFRF